MGDLSEEDKEAEGNETYTLEQSSELKLVSEVDGVLVVQTADGCSHWVPGEHIRCWQKWCNAGIWKLRIHFHGGNLPTIDFAKEDDVAAAVVVLVGLSKNTDYST